MKFNLKMFRNVLPKKSVLKKNKWVLVILALVILIGLYWYSKKSQENYYNSKGNNAWGGPKTLKKDLAGNFLPPVRVDTLTEEEQTKLLRFANPISGIRDTFYKVENANKVGGGANTNVKYCFIERKKGTSNIGEGVINLNDYGSFIDSAQITLPPSTIWSLVNNGGDLGPERPSNEPGCSDLYSTSFDTIQGEILQELTNVGTETLAGDPPVYINEIIHEQVTLYLGSTECKPSNDFLTKIWTDSAYTNDEGGDVTGEELRKKIIEKFPGIELDETTRNKIDGTSSSTSKDIIRCENTVDATTSNQDICKLAGFYGDDKTLSFPLIQYSFLGKTNTDDTEDGYTRYTVNFDPTKKIVGGEIVNEESDANGPKPVYTSEKILAWLADLRGTN